MQDLGVFHSLGALWLRVLNKLETKGAEAVYTDNAGESAAVKELLYLTAEVQDAALPDADHRKAILPHALQPSP